MARVLVWVWGGSGSESDSEEEGGSCGGGCCCWWWAWEEWERGRSCGFRFCVSNGRGVLKNDVLDPLTCAAFITTLSLADLPCPPLCALPLLWLPLLTTLNFLNPAVNLLVNPPIGLFACCCCAGTGKAGYGPDPNAALREAAEGMGRENRSMLGVRVPISRGWCFSSGYSDSGSSWDWGTALYGKGVMWPWGAWGNRRGGGWGDGP